MLLGAVWWWRSQGIKGQVEAAGGRFVVDEWPTDFGERIDNWVTGREPFRTHDVRFWYSEIDDVWLCEHREQLASLSNLRLTVGQTPITDHALHCLHGLNNITDLSLPATAVTDAGMEDVATMTGLQMVGLSGTQISVAGLEQLSSLPSLQRLQLNQTQLRDSDLAVLQQFSGLTSVLIDDSLATDAGIAALCACPQLVQLDLIDTNDETVNRLSGWVRLESLNVIGGPDVTDAAVPALVSLTGLTSLYLRDTSVSDAGLTELQQALRGCEVVRSETPPPPSR